MRIPHLRFSLENNPQEQQPETFLAVYILAEAL